ncbi:hypothetical protein PUN4_520047 [Paraburkholderia unamae]|nr:hypothetical protein PUN4_520047 [Paraburkholderia unamae]
MIGKTLIDTARRVAYSLSIVVSRRAIEGKPKGAPEVWDGAKFLVILSGRDGRGCSAMN